MCLLNLVGSCSLISIVMITPWLFYYNDYFVHYWLKDKTEPTNSQRSYSYWLSQFFSEEEIWNYYFIQLHLKFKNNTVENFCTYTYHGIIQHTSYLCEYPSYFMSYEQLNFHGFDLLGYKSYQIKSYHTHKYLLVGNYWVIPHCIYIMVNR